MWFGSHFFNIGTLFNRTIKNPIKENAKNALLIRFISIPSFNRRPITLNGIPYLISGVAIASESFGFLLPIRNPKIKNGIIFIKSK